MTMTMHPEPKAKLIAALRSGKYEQGQFKLRGGNGFCCLGVACDISGIGEWLEVTPGNYSYLTEHDSRSSFLPSEIGEYFGMSWSAQCKMSGWNDEGLTFDEIADRAERDL